MLLAVAVVVCAGALVAAFAAGDDGDRDEEGTRTERPARPATFTICPDVAVAPPFPALPRQDEQLQNLGRNHMGRSITYDDGRRSARVHIGFEALDALEDIDFSEDGRERLGERTVTTLVAGATPSVRAAEWTESGQSEPCDEVTVVTTNFSRSELLRVVRGVRIRPH